MPRQQLAQTLLAICLLVGCQHPEPITGTSVTPSSPRDGKTLYKSCLLCHSTQEMQRGPILDGMESWYVLDQLKKFNSGQRGKDPKNRAELLMATSMSSIKGEKEEVAVADYIAKLPPKPSLTTLKGNMKRGRELYLKCAGCHGPEGEGKRKSKLPVSAYKKTGSCSINYANTVMVSGVSIRMMSTAGQWPNPFETGQIGT